MRLRQSFEVDAPLARVWDALVDIERVAPCLPGASVSGRNADGSYNGSFSVKIGPTSASYSGKLQMTELDESAHRASMHAQGSDRRGQGGAEATIVSTLEDLGGGRTRVEVDTDYRITGRLARFGRGGMIEDIANKLLRQFADSLQELVAAEGGEDAAAPPTPAPEPGSDPRAAPASAAGQQIEVQAAEPASAVWAPAAASRAFAPSVPEGLTAPSRGAAVPPPPPAHESAPLDAGSLLGSVLLERARRNGRSLAGGALALLALLTLGLRRRARRRAG